MVVVVVKNSRIDYHYLTLGGKRGWGGGGGGGCHLTRKVFLEFFREELTSPPAFFRSCAHIPCKHFATRLMSIGCYGYEIWRQK